MLARMKRLKSGTTGGTQPLPVHVFDVVVVVGGGRTGTESWVSDRTAVVPRLQGRGSLCCCWTPLQSEPLAGALPPGNVSNPAMWNLLLLKRMTAQPRCLETQLGVLYFFLLFSLARAAKNLLTHILHFCPRVTECTKNLTAITEGAFVFIFLRSSGS